MKAIISYNRKTDKWLKWMVSFSMVVFAIFIYPQDQLFSKSNQSDIDSLKVLLQQQTVEDTLYIQRLIKLATALRNENEKVASV